jgi:hypothetical protein
MDDFSLDRTGNNASSNSCMAPPPVAWRRSDEWPPLGAEQKRVTLPMTSAHRLRTVIRGPSDGKVCPFCSHSPGGCPRTQPRVLQNVRLKRWRTLRIRCLDGDDRKVRGGQASADRPFCSRRPQLTPVLSIAYLLSKAAFRSAIFLPRASRSSSEASTCGNSSPSSSSTW